MKKALICILIIISIAGSSFISISLYKSVNHKSMDELAHLTAKEEESFFEELRKKEIRETQECYQSKLVRPFIQIHVYGVDKKFNIWIIYYECFYADFFEDKRHYYNEHISGDSECAIINESGGKMKIIGTVDAGPESAGKTYPTSLQTEIQKEYDIGVGDERYIDAKKAIMKEAASYYSKEYGGERDVDEFLGLD